MQVLQNIAAIAQKALEESNNVTESDVAPILSDALEAIVERCQMEQEDSNLEIINAFVDNLAASYLSFEQIAHRAYDFAFTLLYEPPVSDEMRKFFDSTTVVIKPPNRALVMEEAANLLKQAMERIVTIQLTAELRSRRFPVQENGEQRGQQ